MFLKKNEVAIVFSFCLFVTNSKRFTYCSRNKIEEFSINDLVDLIDILFIFKILKIAFKWVKCSFKNLENITILSIYVFAKFSLPRNIRSICRWTYVEKLRKLITATLKLFCFQRVTTINLWRFVEWTLHW